MIGVGNDGTFFTFDLTTNIRSPLKSTINHIQNIRDIQKMQNYSNRFFISTLSGLHFVEVNKNPKGILIFKLLNSDEGDDAFN